MKEGTQGKLEELFSPREETRKARRIDVDPEKIKAELQEYAGETPVKLHVKRHLETRVSVRETDKRIDISINPKRVRTQEQLDQVMQFCQNSLRLV